MWGLTPWEIERERDWERWKRKNGLIKARKTAKEKGHNSRERECM